MVESVNEQLVRWAQSGDDVAIQKLSSCPKCGVQYAEMKTKITLCSTCEKQVKQLDEDIHESSIVVGSLAPKENHVDDPLKVRKFTGELIDETIQQHRMTMRELNEAHPLIDVATGQFAEAVKYDTEKPRHDLIPGYPLACLADVYTFGAKKYADRNWEKGMRYGRIFAAVMRHLWSFWCGETYDSDSKCHHLAAAAWGCFALMEYQHKGTGQDDRP